MNNKKKISDIFLLLFIIAAIVIWFLPNDLFSKKSETEHPRYVCTWTGCNKKIKEEVGFCKTHQDHIDSLLAESRANRQKRQSASSGSSSSGSSSGSKSGSGKTSTRSSARSSSKKDSYNEGYDDIYLNDDYDQKRYDSDLQYANGVDAAMEDLDW